MDSDEEDDIALRERPSKFVKFKSGNYVTYFCNYVTIT